MAMNANSGPPDEPAGHGQDTAEHEVLPCGRELQEVWERWERGGTDAHADHCPHCAAALSSLRTLSDVVRQAREETQPPLDTAALTSHVMDVVRLELRPGETLPLGEPDEDAWIVEAAAAKALRAAADTIPGVTAGSCRVQPADRTATTEGRWVRGPVHVRLEVTVTLNRNLQDVAERVRREAAEAADRVLGLSVATIDVTVTDVVAPDARDSVEGGEDGRARPAPGEPVRGENDEA